MAEVFVTRPVFPGDDWDELRDEMHRYQAEILARVTGRIGYFISRSAIALGAENNAIARAFATEPHFDLRTLYVAYGHLAAYWRLQEGYLQPRLRGMTRIERLIEEFESWLVKQPAEWFMDNPRLFHLFAVVVADWQTSRTVLNEIALWDELKAYLPLPAPGNLDFFDDPDSYSPYPKGVSR